MSTKNFLGILAKKKVLYSLEDADLAKVIGVSPKTFSRRIKNPDTFTLGEANHLIRFLKFTEDERKEALL